MSFPRQKDYSGSQSLPWPKAQIISPTTWQVSSLASRCHHVGHFVALRHLPAGSGEILIFWALNIVYCVDNVDRQDVACRNIRPYGAKLCLWCHAWDTELSGTKQNQHFDSHCIGNSNGNRISGNDV